MNLQGLGKVEDYQTYLDIAFKNGKQAASQARQQIKADRRLVKSRKIEQVRINAISKSLMNVLKSLNRKFPNFDELAPFYDKLIRCTLDYECLKKSLAALSWAVRQIKSMQVMYNAKLKGIRDITEVNKTRTAFSGRVSSVMKQIKKNLEYLETARKTMKSYPSIKTKRKTIVLAGAPNVGKSTLLAVLTGSKPAVAHYPFTTKTLNLGYDAKGRQYIDTPGLLDRPLADRNKIEQQAILALGDVADLIVFIMDPTETCGYTLPEQRRLLNEIKRKFSAPVILAANKADTGASYKNAIEISAKEGKGINELKKEIDKKLNA